MASDWFRVLIEYVIPISPLNSIVFSKTKKR